MPQPISPALKKVPCAVYRTIEGTDLSLYFFRPMKATTHPGPAMVFFHGGGWRNGQPDQFLQHARYLATRGIICVLAQYRLKTTDQVKPLACVQDARVAVTYLVEHAEKWGIDPNRLIASGGSAGGHLAATTAFDIAGEPPCPRPAALVLFNPVLDTVKDSWKTYARSQTESSLLEDFGPEGIDLSPVHQVKPDHPPTLVLHGKEDCIVPFEQAQRYASKIKEARRRCELIGYEGQGHSFFNFSQSQRCFMETLTETDRFLASLGFLQGESTLENFMQSLPSTSSPSSDQLNQR